MGAVAVIIVAIVIVKIKIVAAIIVVQIMGTHAKMETVAKVTEQDNAQNPASLRLFSKSSPMVNGCWQISG